MGYLKTAIELLHEGHFDIRRDPWGKFTYLRLEGNSSAYDTFALMFEERQYCGLEAPQAVNSSEYELDYPLWEPWIDPHGLKEFIGTFGCGHTWKGFSLADRYVYIRAENVEKAAEIMIRTFGEKWAMLYSSEDEAGVDKYSLSLLPFPGVVDIENILR
jgi:hypothetical protein